MVFMQDTVTALNISNNSNYFKPEIKPYADLPEFVSSVDAVLRWDK